MRESNGYVVSFLLGGLTGASVVLMLTPRSGRQTRELVAERVRSGERSARHALERGQHALERGRDAVVSAAQKGERIAERSLERVREAVGTLSERVTDVAEAVTGAPAEPPDSARRQADLSPARRPPGQPKNAMGHAMKREGLTSLLYETKTRPRVRRSV